MAMRAKTKKRCFVCATHCRYSQHCLQVLQPDRTHYVQALLDLVRSSIHQSTEPFVRVSALHLHTYSRVSVARRGPADPSLLVRSLVCLFASAGEEGCRDRPHSRGARACSVCAHMCVRAPRVRARLPVFVPTRPNTKKHSKRTSKQANKQARRSAAADGLCNDKPTYQPAWPDGSANGDRLDLTVLTQVGLQCLTSVDTILQVGAINS